MFVAHKAWPLREPSIVPSTFLQSGLTMTFQRGARSMPHVLSKESFPSVDCEAPAARCGCLSQSHIPARGIAATVLDPTKVWQAAWFGPLRGDPGEGTLAQEKLAKATSQPSLPLECRSSCRFNTSLPRSG